MSIQVIKPASEEEKELMKKVILKVGQGRSLKSLKKDQRSRLSSLIGQARAKSSDEKQIAFLDKLHKALYPFNIG